MKWNYAIVFIILFASIMTMPAFAQKQKPSLANHYYASGEYEKAGSLYKSIYEERNGAFAYFRKYIDCLLALSEYDKAEKEIREELKSPNADVSLYISLGNLLERKGETKAAEEQYANTIKNLPQRQTGVINTAQALRELGKFDLAIRVYEEGEKILDREYAFAYYKANLYYRLGQKDKMIEEYLNYAQNVGNRTQSLKVNFQRVLDEEDYPELKKQLYAKIQEYPEMPIYTELLQWVFIQSKDYRKALRQAKAMYVKQDDQGNNIYRLGLTAQNDKDYSTALQAYEYLLENTPRNSRIHLDAKRNQLNSLIAQWIDDGSEDQAQLTTIDSIHQACLVDYGSNWQTATIMMDYAEFLVVQGDNLSRGIEILNEVLSFENRLQEKLLAECKLQLGDYYLMNSNIWDASLLYSQVDKAFKEQEVGEEARYRNARLSFFNGDFEWAQAQYDVLKSATSRLISNDAIDQSVFIMDNMGLDTTDVPLRLFANAELLSFQNKYEESFSKLDSIGQVFPDHSLLDDVAYVKAQLYKKQRKYEEAKSQYEYIIEKFPEEIRADNALFELAELEEKRFENLDQAKTLYEKLFLEYSDSSLAIESRKRYRILRGDDVQ